MKTIQIPTTLNEFKALYKTWTSKRYRNNCEVLISLRNDIKRAVKNNYWSADISQTMLERVFIGYNSELDRLFNEAINSLK